MFEQPPPSHRHLHPKNGIAPRPLRILTGWKSSSYKLYDLRSHMLEDEGIQHDMYEECLYFKRSNMLKMFEFSWAQMAHFQCGKKKSPVANWGGPNMCNIGTRKCKPGRNVWVSKDEEAKKWTAIGLGVDTQTKTTQWYTTASASVSPSVQFSEHCHDSFDSRVSPPSLTMSHKVCKHNKSTWMHNKIWRRLTSFYMKNPPKTHEKHRHSHVPLPWLQKSTDLSVKSCWVPMPTESL